MTSKRRRSKRVPTAKARTNIEQVLTLADSQGRRRGNRPSVAAWDSIVAPARRRKKGKRKASRRGERSSTKDAAKPRHSAKRRSPPAPARRSRPGNLTKTQIRAWVKAHYQRTGRWPSQCSGPVYGVEGVTWSAIEQALRGGYRGLPKGGSLAKLIGRRPGGLEKLKSRRLTEKQILAWADAHHSLTGSWPTSTFGRVGNAPGETWEAVNGALKTASRGLSGHSTVRQLLAEHRGAPYSWRNHTRLTVRQILAWADAHFKRTGRWPHARSGRIAEAPRETWRSVHAALYEGRRGLRGRTSLPRLLAEHRGKRHPNYLPRLTEAGILAWADSYHKRTGKWPNATAGPIPEAPGETWTIVFHTMHGGRRGMSGKTTLCRLLEKHRGVRPSVWRPLLNEKMILRWAKVHYRRTNQWPNMRSGPIVGVQGESWNNVDAALRKGNRGLSGGTSLARILPARRRARPSYRSTPLDREEVILWAKAHCRRTGKWPTKYSGPVDDAPGENWQALDNALRQGYRGLPGGSSLSKTLAKCRKPQAMKMFAGRRKPQKRVIG